MISQESRTQIDAVIKILEAVLSKQTYESLRLTDLSATDLRLTIATLTKIPTNPERS